MKTKTTLCLVFAIAVVVSVELCSCNGPPPPPPPPPICDLWTFPDECSCPEGSEVSLATGLCAPPRADRPIDWGTSQGNTAFSLALREPVFIDAYARWSRDHGWNVLRVGAQTAHDWCNAGVPYLPCGPGHGSLEWRSNLITLLDVTARRANVWVQLIPTFTYKSHNEGTQAKNIVYFSAMFDRVNAIVKEFDYKHIIWETFNEVVHPLSAHIKDEDVLAIMEHMKRNTDLPVGTDYHGGQQALDEKLYRLEFLQGIDFPRRFELANRLHADLLREFEWRGRYPYIWRGIVDYIAFHTPRNPEPTLQRMQEAQDKFRYRKPVLVDETVAWASDEAIDEYGLEGRGTIAKEGYGTEDERMWQVVSHLKNIHWVTNESGLKWRPTYHSIWGIESVELGRIPNYDKDIK